MSYQRHLVPQRKPSPINGFMMKRPFLGKRYSRLGSFHDYLKEPVRDKARQRIIEEIIGREPLHEIPCLCKRSDRDILLASIDRWGLPCPSVLCMHCGLIRVNPRWEDNVYSTAYSDLFWRMQMGQLDIGQSRFDLSVRRAEPYAHYILENLDLSGKNVLEIGCSYGAGLHALKSSGARLIGYDYDERMLETGRHFTGLDLRCGGTIEALRQEDRYDLVILRHVFEHMLQPSDELARLRKLLHDGGLLFIEVPGSLQVGPEMSDPMKLFNVFHPYSYTLENLSCVMRKNGFQLVRGDEHIYSLWRGTLEESDVEWQNPVLVKRILGHLSAMERGRRLAAFRAGMARIPAIFHSCLRKD